MEIARRFREGKTAILFIKVLFFRVVIIEFAGFGRVIVGVCRARARCVENSILFRVSARTPTQNRTEEGKKERKNPLVNLDHKPELLLLLLKFVSSHISYFRVFPSFSSLPRMYPFLNQELELDRTRRVSNSKYNNH